MAVQLEERGPFLIHSIASCSHSLHQCIDTHWKFCMNPSATSLLLHVLLVLVTERKKEDTLPHLTPTERLSSEMNNFLFIYVVPSGFPVSGCCISSKCSRAHLLHYLLLGKH